MKRKFSGNRSDQLFFRKKIKVEKQECNKKQKQDKPKINPTFGNNFLDCVFIYGNEAVVSRPRVILTKMITCVFS